MSTVPVMSTLPVILVGLNKSIVPVPTALSSKFELETVVSTLLPAIRVSSVLRGPPNISPVTVKLSTSIWEKVVMPFTVSDPVIT